jgi:hypothetical protein
MDDTFEPTSSRSHRPIADYALHTISSMSADRLPVRLEEPYYDRVLMSSWRVFGQLIVAVSCSWEERIVHEALTSGIIETPPLPVIMGGGPCFDQNDSIHRNRAASAGGKIQLGEQKLAWLIAYRHRMLTSEHSGKAHAC